MKFRIPALVFHVLPIIPFAMGYPYGGIAVLLLIAVAYIKVQKLKAMEADQIQRHQVVDRTLAPARDFWLSLTFLRE